jgi:hypothetical protein
MWFRKRKPDAAAAVVESPAPYAGRIDPTWSAEWIRRTLTGEHGKGLVIEQGRLGR